MMLDNAGNFSQHYNPRLVCLVFFASYFPFSFIFFLNAGGCGSPGKHYLVFKMIESAVHWLLSYLAIPEVGLTSVFVISFISATLLPLGSEPAVFAVVAADKSLFWQVMAVATAGNTLGGVLNYWIGFGAKKAFAKERETRWFGWLEKHGAKTMLLGWMPGIGDPLCTLAGWLKLPFWPCVAYMAIGKLARYVLMTWLLLYIPDSSWRELARFLG